MANKFKQDNVVDLRSAAQLKQRQPANRRVPAVIQLLKEKSTYFLQSALLGYFDSADDTLFELADKSGTNQDQTLFFESMRQVRLCRRDIESHFLQLVNEGFDDLVAGKMPNGENAYQFDQELDIDQLSLVNNEQLELNVAVDSMVNRANEACAESLQHLSMRIDSLVPVKVFLRNNPIGPAEICRAFVTASECLEANIKVKLVLLKLFERHLVEELKNFYNLANDLLIQRNILPSLSTGARVRPSPKPSAGGSTARPGAAPEVLATFRDLINSGTPLPNGGSVSPRSDGGDVGGNVALCEGDLLQLLSQFQVQQVASHTSQPVGIDLQVLQRMAQSAHQASIGQVDRDVINLINLLFEFIVDDRNLAAEMKALLSKLQIPLLKVAIGDKTFFDRGGHPAKRLLNEMATAALGWQPDQTKGSDNLYRRVETIVQQICENPDAGHDVFDNMLMEFLSFIEKEKKQAAILEKRTLDAEVGKAKAEAAREQVKATIAQLKNIDKLSEPMGTLVHEAWANVMFLIALKEGVDSAQWNSALSTVRNLVWSLTEEVTSLNRVRLVKLLPELLKRLRSGLESISYNAYDMGNLFKQLEAEHLRQLKGLGPATKQPEAEPVVAKTPVPTPATAKPQPRVSEQSVEPVLPSKPQAEAQTAPPASPAVRAPSTRPPKEIDVSSESQVDTDTPEPQFLEQVDSLSQGSWFEIRSADTVTRCRLAAIIRPAGKYIFVNRSGMKVAEKDRQELALNLRSGQVRMLDNSMLFDRALESVISNLRQSRGLN